MGDLDELPDEPEPEDEPDPVVDDGADLRWHHSRVL